MFVLVVLCNAFNKCSFYYYVAAICISLNHTKSKNSIQEYEVEISFEKFS